MVHEAREHPDNGSADQEKWCINLDLAYQRSRSFVFPDYIEVRFQAPEGEDERDEETAGADESKFSDRNVLCIFHDVHNLLGRPVQIEHVDHDGEVIRNEVAETDRKRNRCEHDEQRDDRHESRIG